MPLSFPAAEAIFIALYRRKMRSICGRHSALLIAVPAGLVVLNIFLSSAVLGSITVAAPGAPKDASLAISVLLHALLGCSVCIAGWAGGVGVVIALSRNSRTSLSEVLIPALPASIALLAILVSVALVVPYGRIVALVLWLVCLAPLGRWRPPRAITLNTLLCASTIAPFAVAFGVWMGLLWHGPTATLSGSPSGDLASYASYSWSLAVQPYPYVNLGYESGPTLAYFNMLFSALGATMIEAPGFDAFLFIAAGGAASYVLLTGLMLHLYLIDRAPERIDWFGSVILVLSVLAAARYPFWVIESPPVVFVPALTIAVWWMTERGRTDARWALLAMASGLVGTALTKVAAAVILVPIGATTLLGPLRKASRQLKLLAVAIASTSLIYAAYMLLEHLPLYLATFNLGSPGARTGGLADICRDVSIVLLAALAYRTAEPPAALVIIGGLVTFMAFSALFNINFVVAALLMGLIAFTKAGRTVSLRIHAALAFLFAMPAAVLTDPAGLTSGIAWTLCLGSAAFAAWAMAVPSPAPPKVRNAVALAGWLVAATTCVTLVGVARGHIIVDSRWNSGEPELTPDVRDIWRAVRERTPPDSLVFMDQTRDMLSLIGGRSSYARTGQRQVYLADYIVIFDLRNDPSKRRDALKLNESVLRGTMRPSELATRRRYSSFFAVLPKSRPAPSSWSMVHENNGYALYQIPP